MLKGAAGCRRVPMLCFFAGQGCGGSMKKLFLRISENYFSPNRGRRTRRGSYFSCIKYVWRPPPEGVEGNPAGGCLNEISQCSVSGQGRGGSMKNLHMKFPHVLFFPTRAAEVV